MSKAYIKEINANGSDGVHSTSPHWVLTFTRWNNRFLYGQEPKKESKEEPKAEDKKDEEELHAYFLSTRRPLVVENDCASVSVNYSKESHTPSMQAMLYGSDINYTTAIAPGDFVFVNMLNFPEDARRIANNAYSLEPINNENDGFKGLFKVQSVRRVLSIDPATGNKAVMYQISGFAFTEFNNTIYFNPFLLSQEEANNQFLFVSRISSVWEQYVSQKGVINVQNILKLLIDATIGFGFDKNSTDKKGFQLSQNTHFYVPTQVGALLGQESAKSARDIYNYLFGVQNYSSASTAKLADGMNPNLSRDKTGKYYITPILCQGASYLKPEYWNQVTAWSILNQYTNTPINELFTTLRINKEGQIMPTVVFRQMPFSTEKYKGLSTKFLNLPRWKISPDLLTDINIGRDETARINFVQVFSTIPQASQDYNQGQISQQIAARNYDLDSLDIRRSGLKPYIVTSNFDSLATSKTFSGPVWARLLGDALIGGQLKLNGSISCQGIVDPIAVGDNLELDGVVYHIEGLSHSASLEPGGKKTFITSLHISHGVDLRSEKGSKVFGEMDDVNYQSAQKVDFTKHDGNLPGMSDEQYIIGRTEPSEDTTKNNPFPSTPGSPPPPPPKTTSPKGGNKK